MPTPELLDFTALIAPISGDHPAGANLDYELRRKLDDFRTEFNPEGFPEGSQEREQGKREYNWNGVVEQTKQMLAKKSKHILYAARLVEALTMAQGFAGARDGLKLLRLLFTECWDRMMPPIEEAGDEQARVAQLNWLSDPTSGALYPTKIRKLPLFGSGDQAVSWQSWKDGQGNFEAAADAAPAEQCQLLVDDISAAVEELSQLRAEADRRVPDEPPELGELARALEGCLDLAKKALARKSGDATGAETTPGAPAGAGGSAAPSMTRDGIYQQIELLANRLEQIDRHSPVPMLLRRAIKLGPLKFHELVEALSRDAKVIDFLKDDSPPPASE